MGINKIEIVINSPKMGCASIPAFNATKRKVETMSKETPTNRNKTGKSIV
jgi:hypothetical protein